MMLLDATKEYPGSLKFGIDEMGEVDYTTDGEYV